MLLRAKSSSDGEQCAALLRRLHPLDGYPLFLPPDVRAFVTPTYEQAAWVAEREGQIVGHIALHLAGGDPALGVAQRSTGLPADRLVVVSRLFVDPLLRHHGIGRALLRLATGHARSLRLRAVLDVGQHLATPIALYESEGWTRAGDLQLTFDGGKAIPLWVYVSPEADVLTSL